MQYNRLSNKYCYGYWAVESRLRGLSPHEAVTLRTPHEGSGMKEHFLLSDLNYRNFIYNSFNPLCPRLFHKKTIVTHKTPIVIYYHVNTIGREFNWTYKDCPQMRTVGYNGLRLYIILCYLFISDRGIFKSTVSANHFCHLRGSNLAQLTEVQSLRPLQHRHLEKLDFFNPLF